MTVSVISSALARHIPPRVIAMIFRTAPFTISTMDTDLFNLALDHPSLASSIISLIHRHALRLEKACTKEKIDLVNQGPRAYLP